MLCNDQCVQSTCYVLNGVLSKVNVDRAVLRLPVLLKNKEETFLVTNLC